MCAARATSQSLERLSPSRRDPIEHRRGLELRRERAQRRTRETDAQLVVAARIERRVAAGMRDLHAADDAIRPELRRDRTERGDHRRGQPGSLQLRAYRCTAAIAGPPAG